ncbi:MAG: 50S ribosomal protein L6 [Candidatus Yanofskybacteria bacterium GW2011_GWA1_44_21]|uniref:Large ribosomal subunit protein uL6 n=2 Tax=Candidatus Yanofskyibacteriota TaxID=1752733 RepID=A0A1F8H370_9BACT|nr:MAG: 50S ribosomal protein L6 [Candidatus Yanofskybacteria bacterium GW2011_GWA2_44_10]KKT50701.1 MAG: 50S ribosomal protein L6 [Candidatus Yanofskybacteria bacterium GW2011_GWA1_44_21]KKT90229.1 MAG: 50S ribosomal protein L6 [Candidatus Yanofskybacteria bacterium GW2011_GWB1_45_11]OGN02208.1 MAG: 50S ribosomal protein L6 [Candidatus Yanofskybacteria bacterium RIFCSPHIGHO2_01_FULL_44_110b]OGN14834.1 MAG: 50S ribosomal protein L6 [Candidatus Yanofskybacteria bacterium RIFCSPHIGHO2_02_FULL_44_
MSKIGKKQINIPQGVTVRNENGSVFVKGPKGELSMPLSSHFVFTQSENTATIMPREEKILKDNKIHSMWGLSTAVLSNLIKGVTEGFEKALEFQGVGYKANVKGNDLELELGYSHPITVSAPEGISFKVEKNVIKVMGIDKELIGKVAAHIRTLRKPEPYKGSGVRYLGEVIKRKAGKKATAAA